MRINMPSQIEDTPEVKLELLREVAEIYARYVSDPRLTSEKRRECLNMLDDAINMIVEACAGLQDYVGD